MKRDKKLRIAPPPSVSLDPTHLKNYYCKSATHVDYSNNTRRAAFTLAEILITLGIIGVVSALTIPVFVNKYQKQITATRLEHAYSVLYQAIKMSEAENGSEENWEVGDASSDGSVTTTKNFVEKYINPYLKTIHYDTFASSSAAYEYGYYDKNGQYVGTKSNTHYSIVLANGTYLHFNADYNLSKNISVRIDINGKQKPNILGRDTFVANVYPKFGLKGTGTSKEELIKKCSKPDNLNHKEYCGAIIQLDGWRITKNYPW